MQLRSTRRWTSIALTLATVAGCDSSSDPSDAAARPDVYVPPGVDAALDAAATSTTDDAATATGLDAGEGALDRFFPAGGFFTDDVSGLAPSAESEALIAALRASGGWGHDDVFQIDFSLDVLNGEGATATAFTPTDDWYDTECDLDAVPLPLGGNVEGEAGYECLSDGDCHLLVFVPSSQRLFEMWRANVTGGTFYGGCLAVWDTSRRYGRNGRGLDCGSADAAGFPISPLLFTADEVAAGHIDHAIRFILPNDRIRPRSYVAPATHATATTGSDTSPSYGVHLRLRADYPLESLPSEGARVVARALQRYGMYHADGGNIALTAQSDRHTTAQWDGLLDSHDLSALDVEDFEVIDHGASVAWEGNCVRE